MDFELDGPSHQEKKSMHMSSDQQPSICKATYHIQDTSVSLPRDQTVALKILSANLVTQALPNYFDRKDTII